MLQPSMKKLMVTINWLNVINNHKNRFFRSRVRRMNSGVSDSGQCCSVVWWCFFTQVPAVWNNWLGLVFVIWVVVITQWRVVYLWNVHVFLWSTNPGIGCRVSWIQSSHRILWFLPSDIVPLVCLHWSSVRKSIHVYFSRSTITQKFSYICLRTVNFHWQIALLTGLYHIL